VTGEDAEAGADEEGGGDAGEERELQQGEEGCGGAEREACLEAAAGRREKRGAGREQAEEDSAEGHRCHDGFEVCVGDVEFGEALEEGELREDQEIDVGDGDEADTSPSCQAVCSSYASITLLHRSTILG